MEILDFIVELIWEFVWTALLEGGIGAYQGQSKIENKHL